MDTDAIIQWEPGLEMTAAILRQMNSDIDEKYRTVVSTLFRRECFGLVSGFEYAANGGFVGRTYELNGLKCTYLLPNGRIVVIDEDLKINIQSLSGKEYFLCIGETGEKHLFEKNGVPYSRPQHTLAFKTRDELNVNAWFPLKRFVIDDGALGEDNDYVTPCISPSDSDKIKSHVERSVQAIQALCHHKNMDTGECRRVLLELSFRLKSFDYQRNTVELTCLLQEIANAFDFYIVDELGNGIDKVPDKVIELKTDSRRTPDPANISMFFKWFNDYADSMLLILEKVVIVDNTIDYEQLKREITEELSTKIHDQLAEQLYNELHDKLTDEINASITEWIKNYINDDIRPEMEENLKNSLTEKLYPELYDKLYAALYDVLYKPEEVVEDNFNPII